jgi:pantoate--beta-alanine ligase
VIIAKTIADCRRERAVLGKLALVPTMGALHAGHVSLMTLARQHAPAVAVSIFVNPTQFAPNEDYSKYPRAVEADLQKCQDAGVDLVFLPAVEEMYHPGIPEILVDLPILTQLLDGAHRPGHFRGVCQVVAKLFNIVRPDAAVFGQKDFQQLRILTVLTEALDFPIEIVPGPTMRDADGMAMSSRNQYLSPAERERALSINRGLLMAEAEVQRGIRDTSRLTTLIQHLLLKQHLSIDYVTAVDPLTLKKVETITGPTVLAVAARVGNTRLIDNITVAPPGAIQRT